MKRTKFRQRIEFDLLDVKRFQIDVSAGAVGRRRSVVVVVVGLVCAGSNLVSRQRVQCTRQQEIRP
jgi:hypothetical protein